MSSMNKMNNKMHNNKNGNPFYNGKSKLDANVNNREPSIQLSLKMHYGDNYVKFGEKQSLTDEEIRNRLICEIMKLEGHSTFKKKEYKKRADELAGLSDRELHDHKVSIINGENGLLNQHNKCLIDASIKTVINSIQQHGKNLVILYSKKKANEIAPEPPVTASIDEWGGDGIISLEDVIFLYTKKIENLKEQGIKNGGHYSRSRKIILLLEAAKAQGIVISN